MCSKTAPGYITQKIGHWRILLKEQINIILFTFSKSKASMIRKHTSLRIKGKIRFFLIQNWTWILRRLCSITILSFNIADDNLSNHCWNIFRLLQKKIFSNNTLKHGAKKINPAKNKQTNEQEKTKKKKKTNKQTEKQTKTK